MYQADFICTYKLMDEEEEQDQLYRIQLLQAFNLEQWDDVKINSCIAELLTILAPSEEFKTILNKAKENKEIIEVLANIGLSEDDVYNKDDIVFKMLFTYGYFDLIHWCLCDYLTRKSVRPIRLNALLNAL
jgi:hypothetical protein